jgi:adenosylcobinamide kinase/adenosylcobinamide-phosphate guanylyltransferase
MKTVLLGGARSGKSTLALQWAAQRATNVCCLVTGTASDPEMAARIAAHRRERPPHWRVREEPLRLAAALHEEESRSALVLIDCLTVWISHGLWGADAAPELHQVRWKRESAAFIETLAACQCGVILVTNEVGTGVVPDNAAARLFRDEQGWLNQAVARVCDEVFLVAAGLPLRLKPSAGHTDLQP